MSSIPKSPNKKAQAVIQSGGAAATLIIIIALILLLYILFLPPEAREKLLAENETSAAASGIISNKTILLEHPGTLEYIKEKQITHTIPSATIYTQTNAVILAQQDSAYIKTSFFGKKTLTVSFTIDDLTNTGNALFSASLSKRKGSMIVELNGKEIFNAPIATPNLNPIQLPKDLLQKQNTLVVSASDAAFLSTNEFQMSGIKITADIKDVAAQESNNIFTISSTENSNLESASLRLFADCTLTEVGKLLVQINGHEVMNSVPDCGTRIVIPLSPNLLSAGENGIRFFTEKGIYSLYGISVDSQLKEVSNPVYYFELKDADYADVTAGRRDVTLKMDFVDAIELKKADIAVNGHMLRLDQEEKSFSEDISDDIDKGTNGIKIIPLSTLNIVNLEVVLAVS